MKCLLASLLCLLLLSFVSCTGHKQGAMLQTAAADTTAVADTVETDTLADDPLANIPMPKAADELFDDFIFNFAANRKLQVERILFPLKMVKGQNVQTMERSQWRTERYFMRQDFYTLLFDNERQMEAVKDTAIHHAVVEMIYFNTGAIIQHVFNRIRGTWMLTSIETIPISQSHNASFLDFYHHFATDSVFQAQSLAESIRFDGPDPDDDFARMEGVITPDSWGAFAPELPQKMIFNIIYGEPRRGGDSKVLVLRGIANGLEVEMSFRHRDGVWKLTKLTT